MNNICFIPAKGNSRRLPGKNTQPIGGRSLVVRAIESALESGCFSRVCVSSNDDEILKVSEEKGAHAIPRLQSLCGDDVRAKDVIRAHLENVDEEYDTVAMLMPTNPLRTSLHVIEAYKTYQEKNGNTLASITEYEFNPALAMVIKDGVLSPCFSDKLKWEREDRHPKCYHLNGAIFIADYEYYMNNATFITEETVPYIMDRISSIDIDTPDDLILAELYLGILDDRHY